MLTSRTAQLLTAYTKLHSRPGPALFLYKSQHPLFLGAYWLSPCQNWDPPTRSPASEWAPPLPPIRGSPNSDDWRKSSALCLLCVSLKSSTPPGFYQRFFSFTVWWPYADPSHSPATDCLHGAAQSPGTRLAPALQPLHRPCDGELLPLLRGSEAVLAAHLGLAVPRDSGGLLPPSCLHVLAGTGGHRGRPGPSYPSQVMGWQREVLYKQSWLWSQYTKSNDTVRSEGWQMKQCWTKYFKKSPPPKKKFKISFVVRAILRGWISGQHSLEKLEHVYFLMPYNTVE